MEKRAENAGTAAEVHDACAAREAGQPREGIDQSLVRCRRECIVILRGRVPIEKRDLVTFILSAYRHYHILHILNDFQLRQPNTTATTSRGSSLIIIWAARQFLTYQSNCYKVGPRLLSGRGAFAKVRFRSRAVSSHIKPPRRHALIGTGAGRVAGEIIGAAAAGLDDAAIGRII